MLLVCTSKRTGKDNGLEFLIGWPFKPHSWHVGHFGQNSWSGNSTTSGKKKTWCTKPTQTLQAATDRNACFTISTKYCGFSLLEVSKVLAVGRVTCRTRFPTCALLNHRFHKLFTHRFCTPASSEGVQIFFSPSPALLGPRLLGITIRWPSFLSFLLILWILRAMTHAQPKQNSLCSCLESYAPPTEASGIFTTLAEFYFTTDEKKILENCRCIVPNFMND
jgi:hypothetical protein